jgi:hypothetical protein
VNYVLGIGDREKGRQHALSPESKRKRRETWARYRAEEKEAVCTLREQGLVPLAIGPALNMPDSTVAKYLRELERDGLLDSIPPYLSLKAVPDRGAAWAKP